MRVEHTSVTTSERRLCSLSRIDWEGGVAVDVASDHPLTPECWARLILEGAPASTRVRLRRAWRAMGLELGSPGPAPDSILGWRVRRPDVDAIILEAGPRWGLAAELLFSRYEDELIFVTFVRLANPILRAAWPRITRTHERTVRELIEAALGNGTAVDDSPAMAGQWS